MPGGTRAHLLTFDLIPLRETVEDVLTWTRPDFLVLRYELRSLAGLVAHVSVTGMGDSKHALGESAEGVWRFEVFPFASDIVSIKRNQDDAEVGSYLRQPPFEIRLAETGTYRIAGAELSKPQSNLHSTIEDDSGNPVFSFEQVESFPRWQAEVKLDPRAIGIADLPILVISACCIRVFR